MKVQSNALLMVSACIAYTVEAAWKTVQVHVVTRHGQRGQLLKTASLQENSAMAALTPAGEISCLRAGTALRQRYINRASLTLLPEVAEFSLSKVEVHSSDTDRTIASAVALAIGLYPPTDLQLPEPPRAWTSGSGKLPYGYTIVPVHTAADANDVDIRPYDKCPLYSKKLEDLYASKKFLAYEAENKEFLDRLPVLLRAQKLCTELIEGDTVRLKDFYNVYDCINVQKESANSSFASSALGAINNTYVIADWLEHEKFAPEVTGRKLGGNLLTRIVKDFTAAKESPDSADLVRMHIHSAHYPTLKGLLSVLQLQEGVYGIPAYAAALAVELLQDGEQLAVRFMFQNGPDSQYEAQLFSDAGTILAPVPQSAADGAILWDDFIKHLTDTSALYSSYGEWCAECGNTSADVCLQAAVAAAAADADTGTTSDSEEQAEDSESDSESESEAGTETGSAAGAGSSGSSSSSKDSSGSGGGGASQQETAVHVVVSLLAGLLAGAALGWSGATCRMKRRGTGLISSHYGGGSNKPWFKGSVSGDDTAAAMS